MKGKFIQGGLSRRTFLVAGGLAATSLAYVTLNRSPAPAATAALTLSHPAAEPLKIGVLLPASGNYPGLSQSLLTGMQLYFDLVEPQPGGRPIQLIPQDNHLGFSLLETQKFLEEDGLKLVTGIVNPRQIPLLHGLFEQHEAFFVATHAGENLWRPEANSANVFHVTLQYWQANWALGYWAATNLGRKALLVSSFYESGFDARYAFQLGFEAGGGEISRVVLTHLPGDPAEFDITSLAQAVDAASPDLIYAAYSGPEAVEFTQAYAASGLAARVPLVGSSFLTEESLLEAQGAAALGIKTAGAWASNLEARETRAFVTVYQAQTGQPPGPFALLGFEAARVMAGALRASGGEIENNAAFRKALASAAFASPRGPAGMDIATSSLTGALYLRQVQAGPDGKPVNQVLGKLDFINANHPQFDDLMNSTRSGWTNPYPFR